MRALVVACVSGVLLMLLAAPAVAQRDPFAPVVREETVVTRVETDDGVTVQPRPERRPADPLPETGGEPGPWVALAYILVALGAGTIVVARSFGPLAKPRRG